VSHDREEKEHLEDVNQDKHTEKDIETGQGQVGQTTEEGVSQKRNPEHAGGKDQARLELAVFGVKEGEGKSECHRTDDHKEKQDQRDLFARMHVRDLG